jgi:hypothetical protein
MSVTHERLEDAVDPLAITGFEENLEFPNCVAIKLLKSGVLALQGPGSTYLAEATVKQYESKPSLGSLISSVNRINGNSLATTDDYGLATDSVAVPGMIGPRLGRKNLIVIDNADTLFQSSDDLNIDYTMARFIGRITNSVKMRAARLLVVTEGDFQIDATLRSRHEEFRDFSDMFDDQDTRFSFEGITSCSSRKAKELKVREVIALEEAFKKYQEDDDHDRRCMEFRRQFQDMQLVEPRNDF